MTGLATVLAGGLLLSPPVLVSADPVFANPEHSHSPVTFSQGIKGLTNAKQRSDGALMAKSRIGGTGTIQAQHVIIENVLAPGNSPGCISFGGNVTFNMTATVSMEIAGLTPCTEHDQISIANQLTINNATLEIILLGGFMPAYGDSFNLMDWGSISGVFGTIDISAAPLPAPLLWDTSQLHTTGEIRVGVQQFADGDLAPWNNPDGLINAADAMIAQQLIVDQRTPGALQFAHGDMNSDGIINSADLILIFQIVL